MAQSVPPGHPSVDIWDFINCGKCHRFYSPDSTQPPPLPFWVTNCAHVVCNNHLNVDQSCPVCGEQSIEMAPLQREMDPPLSDWFRSAPHAFDAAAQAAKFQLETLASLVRFYRDKVRQQNHLIGLLKDQTQKDRATIERQTREIQHLQQYAGYTEEPSDQGANSKRRRLEGRSQQGGLRSLSSPRSEMSALAPNRLTLPASHQQPSLLPPSRAGREPMSDPEPSSYSRRREHERPGSSVEDMRQYAYAPPYTPQHHAPDISSAQAAPRRQGETPREQTHFHPRYQPQGSITAFPVSRQEKQTKFKPNGQPLNRLPSTRHNHDRTEMLPPPTPQFPSQPLTRSSGTFNMPPRNSASNNAAVSGGFGPSSLTSGTKRFVAPTSTSSNHFAASTMDVRNSVPSTPAGGPQRFRFSTNASVGTRASFGPG